MFNGELQQDNTLTGIGVARSGIVVDTQLPIRLKESEIGKARRMRQDDSWGDLALALVTCQIRIGAVFPSLITAIASPLEPVSVMTFWTRTSIAAGFGTAAGATA